MARLSHGGHCSPGCGSGFGRGRCVAGRARRHCNGKRSRGVSMGVMDERPIADELLTGHLANDLDGSFEALVLAHQDRLFTIAYRTSGDRHDAEELVQDAFVRAYRALAAYPAARIRVLRLRGWLTAILLNAGRNRARVRRVPTTQLAFDPGAEPAADPLARRVEREAWAH